MTNIRRKVIKGATGPGRLRPLKLGTVPTRGPVTPLERWTSLYLTYINGNRERHF